MANHHPGIGRRRVVQLGLALGFYFESGEMLFEETLGLALGDHQNEFVFGVDALHVGVADGSFSGEDIEEFGF